MRRFISILSSRLPALAGIVVIAIALGIAFHLRGNLPDAWRMLSIHANSPLFSDTRTITHGIDCFKSGLNPFSVKTFDPWHRTYNYPPVWLNLRYLGITSLTSNLLGTLLAAMTLCSLLLLFKARTWTAAIIIFLAVTSRAVLFCLERGNVDQLILFLLVAVFLLSDRLRLDIRTAIIASLVILLTVLKIYPAAAVLVLVRNRMGALIALITARVAVAALLLTAGSALPLILTNTPHSIFASFGSFPVFVAFGDHLLRIPTKSIQQHPQMASIAGVVLATLSLLAGVLFRRRLDRCLPPLDFNRASGCIAVTCLSIYCFVFLLGSNFDYRLIFLLGVLAYLVDDLNRRESLRSLPAAILLVVFFWKPDHLSLKFEILDGVIFAFACAWLGTSLLDNLQLLRTPVRSPAPRSVRSPSLAILNARWQHPAGQAQPPLLPLLRNVISASTATSTSRPARTPGSRPSSSRNPPPPTTTGTSASPPSATPPTAPPASSTTTARSSASSTTTPA